MEPRTLSTQLVRNEVSIFVPACGGPNKSLHVISLHFLSPDELGLTQPYTPLYTDCIDGFHSADVTVPVERAGSKTSAARERERKGNSEPEVIARQSKQTDPSEDRRTFDGISRKPRLSVRRAFAEA